MGHYFLDRQKEDPYGCEHPKHQKQVKSIQEFLFWLWNMKRGMSAKQKKSNKKFFFIVQKNLFVWFRILGSI